MGYVGNGLNLDDDQSVGNGLTQADMSQPQQPPANNARNAGPVKAGLRATFLGILKNMAYEGGQAGIAAGGGETDADRAKRIAAVAHMNAQTQQIQQQMTMVPVQLGNGTVVHLPPKMATDLLKQQLANQGKTDTAKIQKRFLTTPQGLYDTQTQDPSTGYPTLIPNSASGIAITPEIAEQYNVPKDYIGKNMTLANLVGLERGQAMSNAVVQTGQGPVVANKVSGVATPVTVNGQRTSLPAMGTPREIADVDHPGETKIVTGAQALGQPGPQSASVQVPRAAAKAEVPTNIGNQKVAFNTAIQHADLLRQAAKALGNGDVQTLSGLQNRFHNEFGGAGPVTAEVIADAYGREVTSMLSKGHMTDSEIATVGKTVDPLRQNYQQVESVLNAYQALSKSKLNMLNQQTDQAVQRVNRGVPKAVQDRMPAKASGGFNWGNAPVKH